MEDINKQLRCYSNQFKYFDGQLCMVGKKHYYNYFRDKVSAKENLFLDKLEVNSFFEYTENDRNRIVGYNFHLPLDFKTNKEIVRHLTGSHYNLFRELSDTLGDSFTNYSCGIRYDGEIVCGMIFYFYPTYLNKEGKIKMTGVIDVKKRNVLFQELDSKIILLSQCNKDEYYQFSGMCVEFKGVSLCVDGMNYSYNIYIKCSFKELSRFFNNKLPCGLQPGPILVAMKICNHRIQGYNFYYAGPFGVPCYGWGEVIE